MPDTPLNPDALEAASRAIDPEAWEVVDKHPDDPGAERLRVSLISEVTKQVAAYLAAALPEATSVEELDQLPDKTVVLDADGVACQRNGFGIDGDYWDSMGEVILSYHIALPARVLHRPEVKP